MTYDRKFDFILTYFHCMQKIFFRLVSFDYALLQFYFSICQQVAFLKRSPKEKAGHKTVKWVEKEVTLRIYSSLCLNIRKIQLNFLIHWGVRISLDRDDPKAAWFLLLRYQWFHRNFKIIFKNNRKSYVSVLCLSDYFWHKILYLKKVYIQNN